MVIHPSRELDVCIYSQGQNSQSATQFTSFWRIEKLKKAVDSLHELWDKRHDIHGKLIGLCVAVNLLFFSGEVISFFVP